MQPVVHAWLQRGWIVKGIDWFKGVVWSPMFRVEIFCFFVDFHLEKFYCLSPKAKHSCQRSDVRRGILIHSCVFQMKIVFFRISTMQLVKLASEWQMRGETLELTNVMLLYLSKWMLCVVLILLHDGPSSGHVRKHSQATRGVPRSMACI